MHLRGKSVRVESKSQAGAKDPPGCSEYDFNWQHTYVLKNPIPLQSVTELTFTATFDNSEENRSNPDPTAFVTWGDQTWEEMAIVFYEVAIPIAEKKRPDRRSAPASTEAKPFIFRRLEQEQALVARLFEDLDRDRDGQDRIRGGRPGRAIAKLSMV